MNEKAKPAKPAGNKRDTRLAEELRANLARRKAQTRARRGNEADTVPDGASKPAGKGKN